MRRLCQLRDRALFDPVGWVESIGEPAMIIIFDVIDDLVKGGRGVPNNANVDNKFLSGVEVVPGSIYVLQPFVALVIFEPYVIRFAFHIFQFLLRV